MQTITYETALRALNEAVKAKGYDHRYEREEFGGCYNVTINGDPDCIVGWALIWLGVPAEWFTGSDPREGDRRGAGAGTVCHMLRKDDMLNVTDAAMELFRRVQARQDAVCAWGEAVTIGHLSPGIFEAMRLRDNRAEKGDS
jgi:hypothetical protein